MTISFYRRTGDPGSVVPNSCNSARLSRREVLSGLGLLGATTLLPVENIEAQAPTGNSRRLDLHHHFVSPLWIKKTVAAKGQDWQQFQDYTPAKAIMDKAGVATAFVSCTEPGVWCRDNFQSERQDAISLAQDMNDYGAKMRSDFKGRFALFALLPIPDIDASLREIEYAFDTLHAEGVGLLTSYGNHWLGDPQFTPVFEELNRRKAVVYAHPIDAPCCRNLIPNVGPTTIEYNTDTTRTIVSVITSGRAKATPNISYIWSHAGGTMPYLVERFGIGRPENIAEALAGTPEKDSKLYHLRRFFYDTAQSTNPIQMQALKGMAGASQIVFGADFPWSTIVNHVQGLQKCGFTPAELKGIDRENALRFLPAKYRSSENPLC